MAAGRQSPPVSEETSRRTNGDGPSPVTDVGDRRERRSRSFLVRVWVEPRELEGAAPVVRGSLRDLQSGEESYFTEPDGLGERLLDGFDVS